MASHEQAGVQPQHSLILNAMNKINFIPFKLNTDKSPRRTSLFPCGAAWGHVPGVSAVAELP